MLMHGKTTIAESSCNKIPLTTPTKNPEFTNKNNLCARVYSIWLHASKNPFVNKNLPKLKFKIKLNRKNVKSYDQIVESLRSIVTQKELKMLIRRTPMLRKYFSAVTSYFFTSLLSWSEDSTDPGLLRFLSSSFLI